MFDYSKKAGMRVLAICKLDRDTKRAILFGRGVMVGMEVPHGAAGPTAEQIISEDSLNPRIDLDTGETVWGCECWWLPEQKGDLWLMELLAAGYAVDEISVARLRKHIDLLEERDEQPQ
jgi:hypothetical protein